MILEYTFHEVANLFPMMKDEEFNNLKSDISKNGLIEPIWTHENKIIDGRNRYTACQEIGVQPRFREWDKKGSLVGFVLSLNMNRRHLDASQKAGIAYKMLPLLEAEAKERQRIAGASTHSNQHTAKAQLIANLQEPANTEDEDFEWQEPEKQQEKPIKKPEPTSQQVAAALAGASARYVADVKKIAETAPEKVDEIIAGTTTIQEVKKEARREEYHQKVQQLQEAKEQDAVIPIPTEPPSLVIADPPWRYDFSETKGREIENHYDTATVEEICSHAPKTADDCVLLLWATAPKLLEAIEVMEAWGFKYKTSAVWDKEKIGMGYWFRGQHELLLVGTKGEVSPPNEFARVSSVFRETRGRHSAKPDCVYEWVEKAFLDNVKLEMYCRSPRPGWAVWGNEI